MKKVSILTILIFAMIFWSGCGDNYKTPEDIEGTVAWLDAQSALPVFPFGTNPIYMYVCSESDRYCRHMDENIFKRPEIIEYMNKHMTCIKVMPDSIDTVTFMGEQLTVIDLLTALKAEAYPSHYFFDRSGQLKGVRGGYINLLEFKQLLKYIAEGYVEKYDFSSYLRLPEAEMDTVWGDF